MCTLDSVLMLRTVETFRAGQRYYCNAHCHELTPEGLVLHVCRRSDGSLGTVVLPVGSFELLRVDAKTGRRVHV